MTTYNTDDWDATENQDGTVLLRKKKPKYVYENDPLSSFAQVFEREYRIATFSKNLCPDAEARVRRLAAELNREIKSAEELVTTALEWVRVLERVSLEVSQETMALAYFKGHLKAYLTAGEAHA